MEIIKEILRIVARIKVEFVQRMRDEKKFSNVEELKEAMRSDEAFSKNYVKNHHAE